MSTREIVYILAKIQNTLSGPRLCVSIFKTLCVLLHKLEDETSLLEGTAVCQLENEYLHLLLLSLKSLKMS